jgi:hypothetical protein
MTETHKRQKTPLAQEAARMTEAHRRQKTALSDQRKEMEHDVNTKKHWWNTSIRLAEKKMLSAVFTQTATGRACNVASLEPRG